MGDILIQYVENGQKKSMPLSEAVLTIYGRGQQLQTMPTSGFDIALRIVAANGMKEAVFVTADTFFQGVIFQVGEARKTLVEYFQKLNDDQQAMIERLNSTLTLSPVAPALSVPFTATVALLVPSDKVVSVAVPGIVKDELVIANPTSLPAGWGYKGVKAGAANRLDFTLSLPAIALNGTGTCSFTVYAQRKLVP